MTVADELFELTAKLNKAASPIEKVEVSKPLDALSAAAEKLKRSFSGSWLGYHAYVYYAELDAAPPEPISAKNGGCNVR
jgi:hypothetical protein